MKEFWKKAAIGCVIFMVIGAFVFPYVMKYNAINSSEIKKWNSDLGLARSHYGPFEGGRIVGKAKESIEIEEEEEEFERFSDPETLYIKDENKVGNGVAIKAMYCVHPRGEGFEGVNLKFKGKVIEVVENGYRVEFQRVSITNGVEEVQKEVHLFPYGRLTKVSVFNKHQLEGFFGSTTGEMPPTEAEINEALDSPIRKLKSYSFIENSAIENRIGNTPDFILRGISEWLGKEYITNYNPTASEVKLIVDCISKLPALNRRTIQDRVVGIYFADGIPFGGITNFLFDEKGNTFCYIAFNPQSLKTSFSEFYTRKENSCFLNSQKSPIRMITDRDLVAFQGILLHESTHVVDFVYQITPYAGSYFGIIKNRPFEATAFTKDVWNHFSLPIKQYDFRGRKNLRFFGLNGGAKNDITEAKQLYDDLAKTPFATLYGATSAGEDLADFVMFYHLSEKMNITVTIEFSSVGKVYSYKVLNREQKMRRENVLDLIYKE